MALGICNSLVYLDSLTLLSLCMMQLVGGVARDRRCLQALQPFDLPQDCISATERAVKGLLFFSSSASPKGPCNCILIWYMVYNIVRSIW